MVNALVIGASGGIGAALAEALCARGVAVTGLSRQRDGFDITDPASVAAHLERLEPGFDLICVATGGLEISGTGPEKSLGQIDAAAMAAQFALNAVGPALVLKHASRLLVRERRGVLACLSARVGSIGDNHLGGWYSYRAAKAALNQITRTAAIELTRSLPLSVCVSIHPGTVKTALTRKYLGRHPAVTPDRAAGNILDVLDRLTPKETGGFFDWRGARVDW